MFANCNFFAFIPLSNWIRGFDRYRQIFDKAALPRTKFPDCFYVLAEDAPQAHIQSALAKTQDLIARLGIPGDKVVRLECRLPVRSSDALEDGMFAEPNTFTGTGIGWRWPATALPLAQYGFVDDQGACLHAPHETITAAAFALPDHALHAWQDCAPRSFSVLPVAKACNANCAFCFSKASISDAIVPGKLDLASVSYYAKLAAARGAQRAVITGGGEPTLIKPHLMQELIACLGESFASILLITNASLLVSIEQRHGQKAIQAILAAWRQAGLTRIAISRHGIDPVSDAALMGLAVQTSRALDLIHEARIASRLICVMQKGGVQTPQDVQSYLERAAKEGVSQVCFKELYVSSLSENAWASSRENTYCQANQVPLSMLIQTLENLHFKQAFVLPWGSPVYVGTIHGQAMQVAAYTEPSVGWERQHGIARSWNWMSDGQCLASLEDPASALALRAPSRPIIEGDKDVDDPSDQRRHHPGGR